MSSSLQVGDHVSAVGASLRGTIRFMGAVQFADGEWVGLELDCKEGKNDGSVKGVKYFSCAPDYGIFLRPSKVRKDLYRCPNGHTFTYQQTQKMNSACASCASDGKTGVALQKVKGTGSKKGKEREASVEQKVVGLSPSPSTNSTRASPMAATTASIVSPTAKSEGRSQASSPEAPTPTQTPTASGQATSTPAPAAHMPSPPSSENHFHHVALPPPRLTSGSEVIHSPGTVEKSKHMEEWLQAFHAVKEELKTTQALLQSAEQREQKLTDELLAARGRHATHVSWQGLPPPAQGTRRPQSGPPSMLRGGPGKPARVPTALRKPLGTTTSNIAFNPTVTKPPDEQTGPKIARTPTNASTASWTPTPKRLSVKDTPVVVALMSADDDSDDGVGPSLSQRSQGSAVDGRFSSASRVSCRRSRKLSEVKAPMDLSQRAKFHLKRIKDSHSVEAHMADSRPPWRLSEWIGSHIDGVFTQAFLEAVDCEDVDMELAFVKALGDVGTVDAIVDIIGQDSVIAKVSEVLLERARSLNAAAAATGEELNAKFTSDGNAFDMVYGTLADFSKGLESLIGSPDADLLRGMEKDHSCGPDSDDFWTTGNYGVTTSPRMEWLFITDPDEGLPKLQMMGGPYAKLMEWPKETKNRTHPRQPLPMSHFHKTMKEINCRLGDGDKHHGIRGMGEKILLSEEFIGIRLYTGPLFERYNAVNRGGALNTVNGQGPVMEARWTSLCKGNRYVTTIHVINSALIKLNKLAKVCTVYRGLSGGILPEAFWKSNESGSRSAVEFGFTSTTTDKEVAMGYASGRGCGTVLEIKTGAIDRGADISMLSQYPHEQEICFPPLTSLEVLGTRVEGPVLVVEVRINVNMAALTVEEVVAKRQKLVKDMSRNLQLEILNMKRAYGDCDGLFDKITENASKRLEEACMHSAVFYNKDENLLDMLGRAIAVKESAMHALDFARAVAQDNDTSSRLAAHNAQHIVKALRLLEVEEDHFVKDHARELFAYFSKVHDQAEDLQKVCSELSSTNDPTRRQAFKDFTKTVLQHKDLARFGWDLAADKVCRALEGEKGDCSNEQLVIDRAEPPVKVLDIDKNTTLVKDVVKFRFMGMKHVKGSDKLAGGPICHICKGNMSAVQGVPAREETRSFRFRVEVPVTVFLLIERKAAPMPAVVVNRQKPSDHHLSVQSNLQPLVQIPKDFEPTGEEPLKGVDETRGKLWDVYKRDFQPGWIAFECPSTASIFFNVTDVSYEWRVLSCHLLTAVGGVVSDRPEVLAHLLRFAPYPGTPATELTAMATKALDSVSQGFIEKAFTRALEEDNDTILSLLLKRRQQLNPGAVSGRCPLCRDDAGDCPGAWAALLMLAMGLEDKTILAEVITSRERGELCKRFRNFWSRDETVQRARHDVVVDKLIQMVVADDTMGLRTLFSLKASPNSRNEETSLVYVAAEGNHCEALQVLLEIGSPMKGKAAAARGGKSPVSAAVCGFNMEALHILVAAGADVNESNDSSVSPVHLAARHNNSEALLFLISEGASVNIESSSGKTALDFATEAGHEEMASVLQRAGGKRNESMSPGRSAKQRPTILHHEGTSATYRDGSSRRDASARRQTVTGAKPPSIR